ncbi:PhoH family protein [Candidatus Aerophobetes bacterium]|uniref:PhoH-like protein n=1 Tax=Aerophobetes bacterium TaxID=2030807 RepID=A0A523UT66_UNCAE|nr:MAG: PhoH family protein [Candidatus Aerophobetes bacterium]
MRDDELGEVKITVENPREISLLCGKEDENLKLIEKELGVEFILRDNLLRINGETHAVEKAKKLVNGVISELRKGYVPNLVEIKSALGNIKEGKETGLEEISSWIIYTSPRGRKVKPRTEGQKEYVRSMRENEVVFSIGPAGTGKTYLAVAMAMAALDREEVVRIILTRPTVEAGEKLGYLPGGMEEKIEPYLRPLYDALYDLILADRVQMLLERRIIEIAPLAYMRGRTLNDAFIILDEAQNTTYEQMKMFLTRIGFGSRVVITGDVTQIDLPAHKGSGLVQVQSFFKGIKGIKAVYLTQKDVVRHRLVQEIVRAYECHERKIK